MRRLASSLACVAAVATTWLAAPCRGARASGCEVKGVVRDADGVAVAGIAVALSEGSVITRTSTDREGRYRFPGAGRDGGTVTVSVVVTDAAHDPAWFSLYHERREIVLTSDAFAADTQCERDFDFASIDERYPEGAFPKKWWPDVITLYRGFADALSLSARLGVDLGRAPLEIQAFYPAASPDTTFWAGTPSYAAEAERIPFIGLGVNASLRADDGWPGNREDHEIGHHVMARGFGSVLPRGRDDVTHGGYWTNPTSTDAWAEGFASFYASMVAKHVRATQRPHWLGVGGAKVDLELDYRPWDLGGLEELAVAGVLLDLEDGPGDYQTDPRAAGLEIVDAQRAGDSSMIVGHVAGELTAPVVVDLELLDDSGTALGLTRTVVLPNPDQKGATGRFVALTEGAVGASSVRLTGHPAHDDDPIDIALDDLWRAIADFTSSKPDSNGRLFDVEDLYVAMKKNFGGKDSDGNGVEDVQQIFVAHGLFADTNGNRRWDEGEVVGQTGHKGGEIVIDGKPTQRADRSVRHRLELPASLRATVELAGDHTSLVVFASAPGRAPVAWVPMADAQGRIAVLPPPVPDPGASASLWVVALAPGTAPIATARLDATTLLADLERHTESFVSLRPEVAPVNAAAVSAAENLRLAWGMFVGGSLTLVFGLALVVAGIVRGR